MLPSVFLAGSILKVSLLHVHVHVVCGQVEQAVKTKISKCFHLF